MKFKIIIRGREVQVVGTVLVSTRTLTLQANRRLTAGEPTRQEGLDAFMEALLADGEVEDCFAAMRGNPNRDPEEELSSVILSAKEEICSSLDVALRALSAEGTQAANLLATSHEGDETEVIRPPDGEDVCRACLAAFRKHYIGGDQHLCMSCINPGFI